MLSVLAVSLAAIAQEDATQEISTEQYGVVIRTDINTPTQAQPFSHIGFGAYYVINPNLIVEGIAGYGTWGFTGALQLQYFVPDLDKFYFKAAFNRAGGGKEKEFASISYSKYQDDLFNLYPVVTTNFLIGKSVSLENTPLSFFVEGGYAYRFADMEDKYRVLTPGVTLDDEGLDVLSKMAPGGFLLSIGLSFKL